MVEFSERSPNWDGVLAVNEEASNFGFGGRCHDVAKLVANGMDGAVGRWICGRRFCRVTGVRAEIVMAVNATASFGHRHIGSVAIDVEDHATSVVAKCGVRMGSAIVEDLDDDFCSVLGSLGLFGGKRIECNRQVDVDGSSVVQ